MSVEPPIEPSKPLTDEDIDLIREANETGYRTGDRNFARAVETFVKAGQVGPWKSAVMLAYGHLWHVNRNPEKTAYEARKVLMELLTHEERGIAINGVKKLLEAAPSTKGPL